MPRVCSRLAPVPGRFAVVIPTPGSHATFDTLEPAILYAATGAADHGSALILTSGRPLARVTRPAPDVVLVAILDPIMPTRRRVILPGEVAA